MPYNVICLSSTVAAVYFGALVNLLLRRPAPSKDGSAADDDEDEGAGGPQQDPSARRAKLRRKRLAKALKVAIIAGVAASGALYLDAELRLQLLDALAAAPLPAAWQAWVQSARAQAEG